MLAPPRSAPLVRPVSPKRNLLRHERQSGVRDRRRWACRPAPEPSHSAVIYTEEQGFLRERITGSRCAAVVAQPALASPRVPYPPVPSWPDPHGCIGLRQPSPRLTAEQMQQIVNDLFATEEGNTQGGAGPCPGGPVTVSLRPGREWLARQIDTTYGSKLAIFIGLTTWDGRPGRSPVCGDLQTPTALPRGLRLSLRLGNTSVTSGADFSGSVRLAELGPGRFSMDLGQPVQAVVVRTGTQRVVGVYSGVIGGTGYQVNLVRGESKKVAVIGGTARCDGGTGSALPAGTYSVVVQISSEDAGPSPDYLTPQVPLRVLPARRQPPRDRPISDHRQLARPYGSHAPVDQAPPLRPRYRRPRERPRSPRRS